MPTRHFSVLEDHISDRLLPFTTMPERDPVTGTKRQCLTRPPAGAVSKLFYEHSE